MAYIGAVAPGYDPTRASVPQLDAERFSGDATTTAFTLTRQVVSPTDIDVIVENVTQEPTVAYSVNGYTLTFTGAPGVGTNNIYVVYRGSGISNYAFVPDGSITFAKLANNIKQFTVDAVTANGTGSTVALTEAPASANSIIVSVDGVIQTAPSNYTLSGSTITFTGVPNNGANVVVRHIGFRTTSTVTALQASSVTATEIADGSITNVKIVSVANTKITGNIVSSQIAPSVTLTTPNLGTPSTLVLTNATGLPQAGLGTNVAGNGPAFSAYNSTSQSISTSTFTKVSLQSEEFDTNNNFDSTTNYRFTPTVAGYYQINGGLSITGTSMVRALTAIYKNGAEYKRGVDISDAINSLTVSSIVYFNGTSDYVELYGYITATSPTFASSGNASTWFNGAMVRSA